MNLKNYIQIKKEKSLRWAQLHLHGIDKDAIGIKLTKADHGDFEATVLLIVLEVIVF